MQRAKVWRSAWLVLVLGALPAWRPTSLQAEEPRTLDLSGARVLASAGWPAALEGFLPAGRAVEPLALPLPEGPLLLLGLWDSDPLARTLAVERLGVDARRGLGGGYVARAWEERGHAWAFIVAQDAAALAAARFELETFTPEAKAGSPRSLDMTQPDEQAGVRMAVGRREVRPRFRMRALGGLAEVGYPLEAIAAHANRLWYGPEAPPMEGAPRSFARVREHGVEPVAFTVGTARDSSVLAEGAADRAVDVLLAWQRRGVRCFALLLEALKGAPPERQRRAHAAVVRRVVRALRPGGLRELLVVPPGAENPVTRRVLRALGRGDPGELWVGPPEAEYLASVPDLTGIPEVLLGWMGPSRWPLRITRAQAAQVAVRAGVPVVLVETWMEPSFFGTTGGLPSLPRGRDADLGEVLAGIVVLPGPAAAEALGEAWEPSAGPTSSQEALAALLDASVVDAADAESFLKGTALALEQALEGGSADPVWLRGMPEQLRRTLQQLPPPAQRVLARHVPHVLVLDGRLSESAWEDAPVTRLGPAEMRALSDGQRLTLGLRVPVGARATELEVRVCTGWGADDKVHLHLRPSCSGSRPGPEHAVTRRGAFDEIEVAFGHYGLCGDPHPGRVIGLGVTLSTPAGPLSLAPDQGPPELPTPGGVVVVVR